MRGRSGRRRRAVIIGGSMAGLFAAAYLRRIGWDVDVFERSRVELVGRGAGITTHPELLQALEEVGAGTLDLGVEVERRIMLDAAGRIIRERPLRQVLTSWDRLQSLLRALLPGEHYHLGHAFERVEQEGTGVVVYFAGGRTERADLLVGGDGFRSGVRGQIAPEVQPVYAGYVVWRGAPEERVLSRATHAAIFPHFAFHLPERQQVMGYPIAGLDNDLRPGHRRYNFIWYRVIEPARLREMCTDAKGRHHAFSIGPHLIRNEVIAEVRADAARILPPPFLEALERIERPFFTPIYDLASPRMAHGRAVLVGDAASVGRPHMGFGVAKAGGDARALAHALEAGEDIDRALGRYDAERQPIGERVMLHGRKLGTHLGVDLRTDAERAMWRTLQDPGAFMDWIAVPNFLAP